MAIQFDVGYLKNMRLDILVAIICTLHEIL